ncbi:unnamed protein product [Amoebophrya sp. A25]|nr:unnamed protein product [Amoebophrya sp. A25]|eukprot:GSA25T00007492001.1
MQAPAQEMVNMRKETPMDVMPESLAQETVKEAIAMEVPIQHEMESHWMKPMFYVDPAKIATCEFHEGCHMAEEEDNRDATAVKTEDLIPIGACCCVIDSLYCTFPACLGCTCDGTLLFLQGRAAFCKPLDCKDEDKRCCAIAELQEYCVIPTRFGEGKCQICCLDRRYAIPCTDNVPCLVNSCGLNCMADFGCKIACCKTIGDLVPRLKK